MAQTTEDMEKDGTVKKRGSVAFWVTSLEAASEAAKIYLESSAAAWEEYLGGVNKREREQQKKRSRYPIYWRSCRTVQPALYSRTPVPVAERMFDDLDDPIARVASLCLERLAKYLISNCPFDRVQYTTRDNFIHTAKATERVTFYSDITEEEIPVVVSVVQSVDEQGQPVQQQVFVDNQGQQIQSEVFERDGNYFTTKLNYTYVQSCLEPVHYCDILHTPNARYWEELDWIGFKLRLNKTEAKKLFGGEISEKLNYSESDDTDKYADSTFKMEPKTVATSFCVVWEIWDKEDKTVYWVSETYKDKFLKTVSDPYDLDGFFPCVPFMLGTCGPDSLWPVPDYIQLEPLILQLHAFSDRLKTLVRATKRRGLFDSSVDELRQLADVTSDGEFIGVKNFQQLITQKGGLESLVSFFPTSEIVDAVNQMSQVINLYEAKFNELYGIPDLLRGVSDPMETAAAQQLKGKYISVSFSAIQREMQRVCRDGVELMLDLAIKMFPEEKLLKCMGAYQMSPEEQAMLPQALELLKDDTERGIRINIETDSTITMNEAAEIEQRNYLGKVLFDGLAAASQLGQNAPMMLPTLAQTLLFMVRGIRDGQEIESSLQRGLEGMLNPPQAGPPPPDYEMMKLQMEGQKLQAKQQDSVQQLQFKAQELGMQSEIKREELNIKVAELSIEQRKLEVQAQMEGMTLGAQQQTELFNQSMEKANLQLEQFRVQMDMQERFLTEARLQMEAEEKKRGDYLKQLEVVANSAPKPAKRRIARIKRDAFGNTEIVAEDMPDEVIQ